MDCGTGGGRQQPAQRVTPAPSTTQKSGKTPARERRGLDIRIPKHEEGNTIMTDDRTFECACGEWIVAESVHDCTYRQWAAREAAVTWIMPAWATGFDLHAPDWADKPSEPLREDHGMVTYHRHAEGGYLVVDSDLVLDLETREVRFELGEPVFTISRFEEEDNDFSLDEVRYMVASIREDTKSAPLAEIRATCCELLDAYDAAHQPAVR